MKTVNLIFPHQLFEDSPLLQNSNDIYLIEEFLFFRQYRFHKQKIAFHRASMKAYEKYLLQLKKTVYYIESTSELADIRHFDQEIQAMKIDAIQLVEPTDDWLEQRIYQLAKVCQITIYPNLQFLNTTNSLASFFNPEKKNFFQTSFYKQQRVKWNILLDEKHQPRGGKWTYDTENRKKYPKHKVPPALHFPAKSAFWDEALVYVEKHYPDCPGQLATSRTYPLTHEEANEWLEQFLTYRFFDFGIYEDAIHKESAFLHHSLLSPLINVGLILPLKIVERTIEFSEQEEIPINSTEGFIRQIIGWREFIRGMYVGKGSYSRTRNFWNFDRKIPSSFYTGTTGIEPIDHTIKRVLETGYCHHIERLMVLGNFMLLCQFDPDEVYRWFMELFIDAYDWVMVPNVYGMCLFADGGTFATKPYIGGSNYIKKMSNYPGGDWEKTWDGLFWSFVMRHDEFFKSNPRTSMLVHALNRMPSEKQQEHVKHADDFVKNTLNVLV